MLLRRGKTFYCRVWVPLDMRERIGRKELKKSLRTDDRQTARTAAKLLTAKAEQFFFRARAGVMRDRELEVLAAELIGEFTGRVAEHKDNRKNVMDWLFSENGLLPPVDQDMIETTLKTPKTPDDVVYVAEWYTRRIGELEQEIATESYSRQTRYWVKCLVEAKGLNVEVPQSGWFNDPYYKFPPQYDAEFDTYYQDEEEPPTQEEIEAWNSPAPPSFNSVCLTLLQAQIDAYRHELERIQGKRNTPLQAQVLKRIEAAKPRPKLSELFEAYKDQKRTTSKWSDKTLHKYTEYMHDITKAIGNREREHYPILTSSLRRFFAI